VSFILDALRKSEHERQRSSVPGLSHVPLAAPKGQMPRWAIALIATLAVAVVALGAAWLLARRTPPPAPAAGSAPEPAAVPLALPPEPSRAARNPMPPPARGASADSLSAAVPSDQAPKSSARAAPASDPSAGDEADAAPAQRPPAAAQPQRSSEPTLPSAAALAAEGVAVPPLKLELHAYSERPAARFVFVNGRKYVEGDTLADGPKVVAIEPNGVVLSQLGRRFLLAPD
jgi:general secretion pathway protein B